MKPPPYSLGAIAVARILCCGESTVIRWFARGILPYYRSPFGCHRRVRVADLVAFADAHGMGLLIDAAGLRPGGVP